MTHISTHSPRTFGAYWIPLMSIFGIIWNVYGISQFVSGLTASGQSTMTMKMTAAQAELYLSLPIWMSIVFAVGVFGGLIGSVALLIRHRSAFPILSVSLFGYILLFAGDAIYGLFDAIPSQLAILTFVVFVAAALLFTAHKARHDGLPGETQ